MNSCWFIDSHYNFEVAFSFLSWWYHGKSILPLYFYVKVGVVTIYRSGKLEIEFISFSIQYCYFIKQKYKVYNIQKACIAYLGIWKCMVFMGFQATVLGKIKCSSFQDCHYSRQNKMFWLPRWSSLLLSLFKLSCL